MVGIYSREREPLSTLDAFGPPFVRTEDSIVRMVMLHPDAVFGRESLKGLFCLEGVRGTG